MSEPIEKVIEKEKEAVKLQTKTAENVVGVLVDRLGKLTEKMIPLQDQLSPLTQAATDIEDQIRALVDELTAEDTKCKRKGNVYEAEISAKGRQTQVTDMAAAVALLEAVEEGLTQLVMKLPMTELKNYLNKKQLDTVTETNYVSKRRIKIHKLIDTDG